MDLFALGLLTLGLTLAPGLVMREPHVEIKLALLLLLLLLSDAVLVVLPADRTNTALSKHLLLTLGLTLGLVLQELHVETLALLLRNDNSVLAVLLVDSSKMSLWHNGALQSAETS